MLLLKRNTSAVRPSKYPIDIARLARFIILAGQTGRIQGSMVLLKVYSVSVNLPGFASE